MSAAVLGTPSNAIETPLASRISAVTVYRSGALVTRVADLPSGDVPSGARFTALPLSLVDSSLRCRVNAPGLRATDLRCELTLASAAAMTGSFEEEVRAANLEVARLRGRFAFLEDCIAIDLALAGRGGAKLGSAPAAAPTSARVETLGALHERLEALHSDRATISEKLRCALLVLQDLHARRSLSNTAQEGARRELQKTVVLSLQGAVTASGGTLSLEYFVPGACWAPSYALRLDSGMRQANIAMRAMVSQRSGEDWAGVALTLSTADHQQWAELPELLSKRIGRRQPARPKKGWRPPPLGTEQLYADYDAGFSGAAVPAIGGSFSGAPPAPPSPFRSASALIEPMEFNAMADELDDEMDDEICESRASFGGMAPDMAPPMPSAAPMPMMAAKSARPESRTKAKKRSAPSRYKESAKMEMDAGAPMEIESEHTELDADLMQYARLRMPAPEKQPRGSLQLSSRIEVYAEIFVRSGQRLDSDTQRLLERAESRARDIASMPTGHSLPWSEHFDYAYQAANRVHLASDGQFHSLPIANAAAKGTPTHVVVPRESTDVFRTVSVENPLEAPLLAGPMDVYWKDAFLLTTSLAFTAPKGTVELGLGVDQAVKVVRNTHYREETAGLMGGSLELSHKIVIEVANEGGNGISLEVRERVPVVASDEDDIKIEVRKVAPMWAAYLPDASSASASAAKGTYRWTLDMAASERTELTATYEIKLPSKYELRGGNRREW